MSEQGSQYRYDILQKRWVIIASERGKRPQDFAVPREEVETVFCPFCPGHEEKTPPEIAAIRDPGGRTNGPGWRVRVVPNKFPALRVEGEPEREAEGLYDRMNGIGAHEVVIESPDHRSRMCDREVDDIALTLRMYRDRLTDLMRDQRLKYILIFKNSGSAAGASLSHPHSQIIATTVTPRTVALELNSCREHHHIKERCLICDIIKQELGSRERLVTIDDRYVAFCPYAARFPFELFIAPRFHQHDYSKASDHDLRGLAAVLRDVLGRYREALDDPPYNFILHTSPNANVRPRRAHYWDTIEFDFHWHMELFPRLTRVAGFEWGTGFYINPTSPEDAARYLRSL
ncbi:MAG: galactose-1-phosphate uridylyltransferase [Planctomycetes bacterium]|nr:galactose-1-phosphate uridylyltransferase [Planctomycetota bacterium]